MKENWYGFELEMTRASALWQLTELCKILKWLKIGFHGM